jgi:hypothetical protein
MIPVVGVLLKLPSRKFMAGEGGDSGRLSDLSLCFWSQKGGFLRIQFLNKMCAYVCFLRVVTL